jgi:flagellar hook-associated protein 3 FlgL
MTVSGVGTTATQMAQQLVNLNDQLDSLTQQLSTGQKTTTYSGISSQAQLLVGLNSQLGAINSYQDSNNTVSARLAIQQSALTQFDSVTQTVQQSAMLSTYSPGPNGQTVDQTNAASQFNQLLSLLNTQGDNGYLFSGDATNQPSVASSTLIMNGTATQAGLLQVMAERNEADLGANGLGRLVIPAPSTAPAEITGSGATLASDAPATVASNGITFPLASGGTLTLTGTGTSAITFNAGDTPTTLAAEINAATPTTGVTASVNSTTGVLVLTGPNANTPVTIGAAASNATLGLPTAASTISPTNLVNPPQDLTGQSLTITVGANPPLTINFGTGPGDVSTLAGLQTQLATLTGGTATVDASGNISIAATNTTDQVTVSSSPASTAATFGIQTALANPTSGTSVSLSEDVPGSPFGFKLASATSTLTGANLIGPTAMPPSGAQGITVNLNTNPNPGDTLNVTFNLPDGTQQELTMTATTTTPPGTDAFTIGATPAATAANLQSALTTSVQTLAATQLTAASDVEAANNFFNVGVSQPPQRVQGVGTPPSYYTATSLVAGTPANTVSWYTGEMSTNPRSSVTALVDPSTTVSYGVEANEPAITNVIENVAVFAAASFSASNPNSSAAYLALGQRVGLALNPQPGNGAQTTVDIETDLSNAQTSIQNATTQQTQTQTTLQDFVQGITGVSNDQVAAEILTLQTQLQASLQATAMLSKLSIVNYISS